MLRSLFRRPRTVRVPVDNHAVDVQTVKLSRQSRSSVSRFLLMGAVTTLTIQGMKYLDPLGDYKNRDIIQEQLEKARKENPLGDKNNQYGKHWGMQHSQIQPRPTEDMSITSSFSNQFRLTLPIWIRKGSLRPFEVWDPEFKDFVKLQADDKRIDTLKRQVFETVMLSVKQAPRNFLELRVIGFNGKVTGTLDVVPPLFAPPQYQVPCMLFSVDPLYVKFSWRQLPPDTAVRVERVFRPLVALDAATAAARVFLRTTYAITKAKLNESFGINKSNTTKQPAFQVSFPEVPKESAGVPGAVTTTTQDGVKSTKPIMPYFPDINDGQGTRKMHQDIVGAMPYSSAITQAAAVFNQVRNARQKAAVSNNVRGICQIRGYLNFSGTRGKFRMEVIAHYLPGENVFIGAVQVKQRYIVQDYNAMQQLRDKIQLKKLEELKAKANAEAKLQEKTSEDTESSASTSDRSKSQSKSSTTKDDEKK